MMKFFKQMNEQESLNWKKGAIFGFYTYMLIWGSKLIVNVFLYMQKKAIE